MNTHSWTQRVLVAALLAVPAVAITLAVNTTRVDAVAPTSPTAVGAFALSNAATDTSSQASRGRDREITIPAGTALRLRLDTSHASNTARVEDRVEAHLIAPVVVNGVTAIPSNTEAIGYVTMARPSAKVKGRGYLAVRFTEVRDDDDRYRVTTRTWAREAPGTKKRDAAKIAVPGVVGGVVGAIVGGKKGAAIGAGVGAGAGTGVVLSTAGQEVRLPRGSTLLVRLSEPLVVRVSS